MNTKLAGAVLALALACGAKQPAVNSTPVGTGLSILAGLPGGPGGADDVGAAARLGSLQGMVADGQGNLYFADASNHAVRKLNTVTRAVTTLAGAFGEQDYRDGVGSEARFSLPFGITIDGGDLYVTDATNVRVRKVVIATGQVTTLAGGGAIGVLDGIGSAARFVSVDDIASDGRGNLFVVDSGNKTIRKIVIATAEVTTVAGSPEPKAGDIDGVGTEARFPNPTGLAVDGNYLYVSEGSTNRIRRIDLATAEVTTPFTGLNGLVSRNVDGMTADHQGHLYVADSFGRQVVRVDVASGQSETIAGVRDLWGVEDGPYPDGRFAAPGAVALSTDGALYVGELVAGTIRRVDLATRAVETVAGLGPHQGSEDGALGVARLSAPRGVTADGAGEVFIADTASRTLRQLTPATRLVTTVAGTPLVAGSSDGVGAAALFAQPVDLVAGADGDVFVVDAAATVRRLETATRMVTTFAGVANSFGGADGVGTAARFWSPQAIGYDGAGRLYVTDLAGARVRRLDVATADVAAVAWPGEGGSGEPMGVAADAAGNIYVASAVSHTIAKVVVATGQATTIAGMAEMPGAVDGVGAAARFNRPMNLALDPRGYLFVAEPDNHLVRRIELATGEVTTFAGTRGEAGVKAGPLPGRLNKPRGLALLPSGDLLIADEAENVILVAH